MKQLNLLEWKPSVEVIPFPTDKRVGKVRSFVDHYLTRKTDNGRLKLWQSTLTTIVHQMRRAGIPEPIILQQIDAFKQAVVSEIQHRQWTQQPGGAA